MKDLLGNISDNLKDDVKRNEDLYRMIETSIFQRCRLEREKKGKKIILDIINHNK